MVSVVIDTNVLVSAALKWDSVPGSIIDLALNGLIVPFVNNEILREYEMVLRRPKFHLTDDIVSDIVKEFRRCAVYLDAEHLDLDLPDPKDLVFYELTMEVRKNKEAKLVTGNIKHFPAKPFVLTPRQFLNYILEESNET